LRDGGRSERASGTGVDANDWCGGGRLLSSNEGWDSDESVGELHFGGGVVFVENERCAF